MFKSFEAHLPCLNQLLHALLELAERPGNWQAFLKYSQGALTSCHMPFPLPRSAPTAPTPLRCLSCPTRVPLPFLLLRYSPWGCDQALWVQNLPEWQEGQHRDVGLARRARTPTQGAALQMRCTLSSLPAIQIWIAELVELDAEVLLVLDLGGVLSPPIRNGRLGVGSNSAQIVTTTSAPSAFLTIFGHLTP
jgi:hypothetical protein